MNDDISLSSAAASASVSVLSSGPLARPSRAAVVLALALGLAPALALSSALAMAPLLALTAVAMLAANGWRRPVLVSTRAQAVLLLALLAWAAVTSRWSLDETFAGRNIAMLIGTVLGGVIVQAEARRLDEAGLALVVRALSLGLLVVVPAMLFCGILEQMHVLDTETTQKVIEAVVQRMNRGSTVCAMLLWVAALGQVRFGRPRRAVALVLVVLVGVVATHDLAAKLAIVGGVGVWAVARLTPRLAAAGLGVLMLTVVLLAPLAALHLPPPRDSIYISWLPRSGHHRMTIWSFTAQRIAEKPLLGWGLDSSRAIPGAKDEIFLIDRAGKLFSEAMLPLHPHNAALQIWLELGGIGAGLVALCLVTLPNSLARGTASRNAKAFGAALLFGGFLIASVSYGVWQSWWLSTVWLAVAGLGALSQAAKDARAPL
ncbi:MAG TPA: O-antigen ligase family protein [Patescibacteria group bacterium]|nr:O-antigen ligase family protein [Patescibacteria group bacterium]